MLKLARCIILKSLTLFVLFRQAAEAISHIGEQKIPSSRRFFLQRFKQLNPWQKQLQQHARLCASSLSILACRQLSLAASVNLENLIGNIESEKC
jgi:hypothetical protein